jgi:hypothetical protein
MRRERRPKESQQEVLSHNVAKSLTSPNRLVIGKLKAKTSRTTRPHAGFNYSTDINPNDNRVFVDSLNM